MTAEAGSASSQQGIGREPAAGPLRVSAWRTTRGLLALDRPRILGILNVTPDSFFEESRLPGTDAALAAAERMLAAGADVLDVGGESTRPGARSVDADQEIARVVPVVRGIVRRWPDALVSVDTVKSAVARAALDEGAAAVNDVSALRLDPQMANVAAETGAGLVLMHSRGSVETMASYELAEYGDDVVAEVARELNDAVGRARAAGVARDCIVLDPGLGFAKRTADNVALLARLAELAAAGYPVLVGPSRKRFLGELAGGLPAAERLPGTIVACVTALLHGARLFRVHDVAEVRAALDVAEAIHAGTSA